MFLDYSGCVCVGGVVFVVGLFWERTVAKWLS